jgi:hypothetical protein
MMALNPTNARAAARVRGSVGAGSKGTACAGAFTRTELESANAGIARLADQAGFIDPPVDTDIPCPILALFYWRKGGKHNTM